LFAKAYHQKSIKKSTRWLSILYIYVKIFLADLKGFFLKNGLFMIFYSGEKNEAK
jgi:hypothetical protein